MEGIIAAKEIAEFEKQKQNGAGTISGTVPENPANFSEQKTEGNSHQIN
jgi:hypothetical protein